MYSIDYYFYCLSNLLVSMLIHWLNYFELLTQKMQIKRSIGSGTRVEVTRSVSQ